MKLRDLNKLQYGCLVNLSVDAMSFNDSLNFYAIFLGFYMKDKEKCKTALLNRMNYTGHKIYDIYSDIENNFMYTIPVFLPIAGMIDKVSDEVLQQLVELTFSKSTKVKSLISGSDFELDDIHLTNVRISKKTLDNYIIKCRIMSMGRGFEYTQTDELIKMCEEIYDANKVQNVDLVNMSLTKNYKPFHFYIMKTEKTLRLYYCVCPTKVPGACLFALMYNGTPSDPSSTQNITEILRNCRTSNMLNSLGNGRKRTSYRVMSTTELLEVPNIESMAQLINNYDWHHSFEDVVDYNTAKNYLVGL